MSLDSTRDEAETYLASPVIADKSPTGEDDYNYKGRDRIIGPCHS